MSIHYAGAIIAEARQKSGLTQEQLSEGICDSTSLSCIERGISGVSPATFRVLMERIGVSMEVFPVFVNRTDFDCFYILKRAQFYLNAWFLKEAYEELTKVYDLKCAENKFHYQEWLLLQCRLQLRSGVYKDAVVYELADKAIRLSRPNYTIDTITSSFLSVNEVELLLCLAEAVLSSGNIVQSLSVCMQLDKNLQKSTLPASVKQHLLGENAVLWCRILLVKESYAELLERAELYRHMVVDGHDDSLLFELTFFTGLGHYFQGNTDMALQFIKTAFYTAHSVGSCYATRCRNYILQHTNLVFSEAFLSVPDIPLVSFPCNEITEISFQKGIYDLSSLSFYQLGNLIHDLRIEQHITQTVLCQGLCAKSTLSKIESNTLMPDAILAETLLQRLGIADTVFSFFSSKGNSILYELKNNLIRSRGKDTATIKRYLAEGEEILKTNYSPIYQQYFLFKQAVYQGELEKHISELENALAVTLPDFNICHIMEYRLSWNELTILNHLANAYAGNNDYLKAIYYVSLILDYIKENGNDILHWKRIYCVTSGLLTLYLFHLKQNEQVVSAFSSFCTPAIFHSIYFTSGIYGNYCQALCECNRNERIPLAVNYAYYGLLAIENNQNAQKVKRSIWEDFQIEVD